MGKLQRFHATLIRPLADQRDRDGDLVDPAGLRFDPMQAYPIYLDFGFGGMPVGRAKIELAEDGSIVARGELVNGPPNPMRLAAGLKLIDYTRRPDGSMLASASELTVIGLVDEHQDPEQPVIEYDE